MGDLARLTNSMCHQRGKPKSTTMTHEGVFFAILIEPPRQGIRGMTNALFHDKLVPKFTDSKLQRAANANIYNFSQRDAHHWILVHSDSKVFYCLDNRSHFVYGIWQYESFQRVFPQDMAPEFHQSSS